MQKAIKETRKYGKKLTMLLTSSGYAIQFHNGTRPMILNAAMDKEQAMAKWPGVLSEVLR